MKKTSARKRVAAARKNKTSVRNRVTDVKKNVAKQNPSFNYSSDTPSCRDCGYTHKLLHALKLCPMCKPCKGCTKKLMACTCHEGE
ncbi:MAG: hypothetical protein AABY01_02690 [Nanoarchaeota archaeon]